MSEARIAADVPRDGVLADGVAELRANLLITLGAIERPIVAVTSPHMDERRRHVAGQLAAALAQTARSVLLLDADAALGLPAPGFQAATELAPGLSGVTAPAVLQGDPALLMGREFGRELEAQRGRHDVVIVACPAVLDVPEARAVAAACSGTLLVVADGESRRDDAVYAAQVLRESKVRLLGAVVHRRD